MIEIKLYQMTENNVPYWYLSLERVRDGGFEPREREYAKVYETKIDLYDDHEHDLAWLCEAAFVTFNRYLPEDYNGRRITVSDVIVINGIAFYCDSIGFNLLPNFFEGTEQ